MLVQITNSRKLKDVWKWWGGHGQMGVASLVSELKKLLYLNNEQME